MKECGIYWLASYPKSGNTWFRVFLANLRRKQSESVDINQLDTTLIASARELFDKMTGLEGADLTQKEIERLRPRVYEEMLKEAEESLFLKIHDAYTYTNKEEPLVSQQATAGAIYLLRNPLDVAVSFANHSACDVEQIIDNMGYEGNVLCGSVKKLPNQLPQKLLSWSSHVESWVNQTQIKVHVMRYEDMLLDPQSTFTKAVEFARLPYGEEEVERAIALSSFQELQRQEQEHGFKEKMPRAQSFFHQGKIGRGQEVLTQDQQEQIIAYHGQVMSRFGYL